MSQDSTPQTISGLMYSKAVRNSDLFCLILRQFTFNTRRFDLLGRSKIDDSLVDRFGHLLLLVEIRCLLPCLDTGLLVRLGEKISFELKEST